METILSVYFMFIFALMNEHIPVLYVTSILLQNFFSYCVLFSCQSHHSILMKMSQSQCTPRHNFFDHNFHLTSVSL